VQYTTGWDEKQKTLGPLKNGFAASQKSFPLRERPDVIMIHDKPLTFSLERRKTFDSPLANHFSSMKQNSLNDQ